jgi:hypothetical protein
MDLAAAVWETLTKGEHLLLAAWFVFSLLVIAKVDGW